MSGKRTTVKTVSTMMIISLAGKVLGLARDMLYGFKFGTGTMESAAFAIAGSLPRNFLDAVFASVITASFIPIYNEAFEKDGEKRAERLGSSFMTLVIIFSGIASALFVASSGGLVELLYGGYDAPTRALTARLLRIMFPMIVFSGAAFCMTGILQCMGEFNVPAAMSVVSNIVIIVYYMFFVDRFGITGLAWVFLLGWASQAAVQIPFLIKRGFRFKPVLKLRDPYMTKIYWLVLPVMIGTWAQPVNLTVNAALATYAGAGAVAALYFANTLFSIITGVFVLSVSNMVFPELSRLSVKDDKAGFAENLNQTLRVISFILLPMTAGLIILSEPVIRIIFEHGMFNAESTGLTSSALIFYSAGMLGYGFQTILSRGFYALKDGKTPLYTSLLAIAVNASAGYLLLKPMSVGGPALASSISITVVGFMLLYIMAKRHKGVIGGGFFRDLAKMLCAAIGMSGVVLAITRVTLGAVSSGGFIASAAAVACGVLAGVVVYMVICRLLKVREADMFFGYIRRLVRS